METAGHAVVFSGTTVAIGLLALVVLPVPFIRSIGFGGMLIPLVSVAVDDHAAAGVPGHGRPAPRLAAARRGRSGQPRSGSGGPACVVRHRGRGGDRRLALLALWSSRPSRSNWRSPGQHRSPVGDARDAPTLERAGIRPAALTPFEVLVEGDDPAAVATGLASVDGVPRAIAPEGDDLAARRHGHRRW